MRELTFNEFRGANRVRCLKWHPQGIDLGLSAAQKFNESSERVGFPDRVNLEWT